MDDLNAAVAAIEEAVKSTLHDHLNRAVPLNNLGNALQCRFERTGSMDDLNAAVEAIEEAVKLTPRDHPIRASRLNNLGIALGRRFERTGSMDDLNAAVNAYDESVGLRQSPPSVRIFIGGTGCQSDLLAESQKRKSTAYHSCRASSHN